MKTTHILRNFGTVTALAGLLTGLGAVAASAATTRAPIGCPACPSRGNNDGAVTGTVDLSTCPATPTVFVTSDGVGVDATTTQSSPGVWTYFAGSVPPGEASVSASISGGACSLGHWVSSNTTVDVPQLTIVSAPELDYVMPAATTTIDGGLIAAGARSKFADLKLHLNDYGPQHGNSHQLDNGSYLSTGSTHQTFTIPEASYNMKLCSYSFCPSLGHGDFYVNDMNLSSTSFSWTSNGTLQLTAGFESAGREIKGFYTNSAVGETDDAMPDANIANATVTVSLVPVADGSGGVSFAAVGTPTFTGNVQATGACSVLGWDWCNSVTGYKATIQSAFGSAALSAINSPAIQSEISAQVRPLLDELGIGYVTAVVVSGYNVTIASN